MRQFFRQINVRQKALVLLSISMVSVFAMNLSSNLWLANKNPMHENLAGLTPLLYTPNTQDLSPEEWLVYLNQKQENFDIEGVAIYDYQGRIKGSSSGNFPSSLGDLDPATLGSSRALIPGVGFTLMVDLKAHTFKIFALEIFVISTLLLVGGIIMIYVILYFINRLITRPILSLTDTTNEIALEQNYSLRAKRFYPDEVGTLAENFNFMLNRIQQDDYMMRPIKESNGMIWQQTPMVTLSTDANYNSEIMQGMNYPINTFNYSSVGDIAVVADFTANNIDEARYMLAVFTFLKVATKAYFGDTAVASEKYGTPPPVLLFEYLGDHGFNKVPVVVSRYEIQYPGDVQYVPVQVQNTISYVPAMTNVVVSLMPTYTPHKMRRRFSVEGIANGASYRDGFI